MKLLLISPASAIHTIRWANSLINHVDELHLVSMHTILEKLDDRIEVHHLKIKAPLGYLFNYKALKKIIVSVSPDIINTHYLSGYGMLSYLSVNKNKTPYLLSMWGSDVYIFPNKSIFHKYLIKLTTEKATRLASTSIAMRKEFQKIYPSYKNEISLTPFGVDTKNFSPNTKVKKNSLFTIGIAKNLEGKYGVEYLIQSFKEFNERNPKSQLEIIGDGIIKEDLKKLSRKLNLENKIIFHGRVNNNKLSNILNTWDVYVIPSLFESFGVSAVEASSCALPVIGTNVGGLPEVIEDNITGFIIPSKNPQAISEKLQILFDNVELRVEMGKKGRELVLKNYDWEENVKTMMVIYNKTINDFNSKN
ncbi:hypothetical protein IX49_06695 [Cellulophaga lytica]|uniref:glycosyltransferase n=1 Tax=Cellulophaga lytica TaxID=979 RepID=UPI0004F5BA11|nr:glycosyltransferase [Cellulophaga lytica]AIM60222.1 hypothetical protein IX49_06695 [Cellulophaga lytica]MDO6851985.1 glycosyltransferase [Cellulophaga lytica]